MECFFSRTGLLTDVFIFDRAYLCIVVLCARCLCCIFLCAVLGAKTRVIFCVFLLLRFYACTCVYTCVYVYFSQKQVDAKTLSQLSAEHWIQNWKRSSSRYNNHQPYKLNKNRMISSFNVNIDSIICIHFVFILRFCAYPWSFLRFEYNSINVFFAFNGKNERCEWKKALRQKSKSHIWRLHCVKTMDTIASLSFHCRTTMADQWASKFGVSHVFMDAYLLLNVERTNNTTKTTHEKT